MPEPGLRGRQPRKPPEERYPLQWIHEYLVAEQAASFPLDNSGGVTALGCTIGQGVTGISTLAAGSFITLAAILAGCAGMLKFDEWRLMRA